LSTNVLADYQTAAALGPVGKKLENFNFLSADLQLDIVVQGQPFAAGQWVLTARPYCRPSNIMTASKITSDSMVNSKILPHVVIDPSKTCSYQLVLPCLNHIGVFNLKNTSYGSYSLTLWEFNALKSGTATTASMTVCIYVSLKNVSAVGTTLLSGSFSKEKTSLSTIVKTAASASKLFIPVFGPEVGIFSAVGESVGNLLAWFGYSKPPITETNVLAMTRVADNYSQYDGRSIAPVLAGETTNSVGLSNRYGGGKSDDMSLAAICAKPGLISQTTVTMAMASEADIFGYGIPVCPTLACWTPVAGVLDLTPMGGCCVPFGVWSGDITFTVEVVASVFHRATILVAWDPNGGASPTFANALSTLQNVTIAVSGNSSTDIVIPWKQPEPFKHTFRPADPSYGSFSNSNLNGRLYFYLINPVTNNGSTDGFEINLYTRSDNLFLAAPDHTRVDAWSSVVTTLLSGDFQSASVSFGAKTNLENMERRSFGERYVSVKQLTSKLGPVVKNDSAAQDTTSSSHSYYTLKVPNLPLFNTATAADWGTGTAYVTNNLFGWFSQAYVGYRGGVRWSFVTGKTSNGLTNAFEYEGKRWVANQGLTAVASNSFSAALGYYAELNAIILSYAFTLYNMAFVKTVDLVAPTLVNAEFIPTAITCTANMNKVAVLIERVPPAGATYPMYESYIWMNASADDGTFVFFQGFPKITAYTDNYL